jgi:hypothetical protein
MSLIKIKYSVNGATPLVAENYILQANANPATIAAGEQINLDFNADGVYFTLVPIKTQVKVSNATLVSWTSKSPFTSGKLVIDSVVDESADVEITIPVKVKVAPQLITKPFLNQVSAPIDTRLVLSKKEMLNVNDTYQPDVYFALCKDDGHLYLYNKNNESNSEIGKFRIITDVLNMNNFDAIIDGGEITA